MQLSSSAFTHGAPIPKVYTCQGEEKSPPLEIRDVPQEAKSLALIMHDPDVPDYLRKDRLWVHWILFNLDPKTTTIQENTSPSCKVGVNTGGKNAYQGPCPPDREHRYFFTLYALDTTLDLPQGASKNELERAMEGHTLQCAELMGTYVKM